ncbi:hypothetical protein [Saprospira sp. CCB-QB6]
MLKMAGSLYRFNSVKVQLKEQWSEATRQNIDSFNSVKVQLKAV